MGAVAYSLRWQDFFFSENLVILSFVSFFSLPDIATSQPLKTCRDKNQKLIAIDPVNKNIFGHIFFLDLSVTSVGEIEVVLIPYFAQICGFLSNLVKKTWVKKGYTHVVLTVLRSRTDDYIQQSLKDITG